MFSSCYYHHDWFILHSCILFHSAYWSCVKPINLNQKWADSQFTVLFWTILGGGLSNFWDSSRAQKGPALGNTSTIRLQSVSPSSSFSTLHQIKCCGGERGEVPQKPMALCPKCCWACSTIPLSTGTLGVLFMFLQEEQRILFPGVSKNIYTLHFLIYFKGQLWNGRGGHITCGRCIKKNGKIALHRTD